MKNHRAYCDTCGRACSWAGPPIPNRALCPSCGERLTSYLVAPYRTPIEPVPAPRGAESTPQECAEASSRRRRVAAALRTRQPHSRGS